MNDSKEPRRIVVWARGWNRAFLEKTAEEYHLHPIVAGTMDEVSAVLSNSKERGSGIGAVFVDGSELDRPINEIVNTVHEHNSDVRIILLCEGSAASQFEFSRGSSPDNCTRVPTGEVEMIDYHMSKLSPLRFPLISQNVERVLPADAIGDESEGPFEPTELADAIEMEMSELAASIHLDREERRRNFVQMLLHGGRATLKSPDDTSVRCWKRYCQWVTAAHQRTMPPRKDIPRNALVRFAEILRIGIRYTYFLVGRTGCGKTTFLHEFFDGYVRANREEMPAWYFFVDFLRYDFVRDAQSLAVEIQQRVFEFRRENGSLPDEFVGLSYSKFVRLRDYDATALLDDPPADIDLGFARDYLASVLYGQDSMGLDRLFALCTSDQSNVPHDSQSWRTQLLETMNPESLCRIVKYYALQSLENIREKIAGDILLQAERIKRLRPALASIGADSRQVGRLEGDALVKVAQLLLRQLSEQHSVFVVIDNADRARFPAVELQIFRTAWEFLPPIADDLQVNLVFSMRTDTYERHGEEVRRWDDQQMTVHEVANIESIELSPPSFRELAQVRIENCIARCRAEGKEQQALIIRNFVASVLASDVAADIFEKLFAGDMRENLTAFQQAIASHHMEHTNSYFLTRRLTESGTDSDADLSDSYLAGHRLITSLILGKWNKFRQNRSRIFLNVYNARLSSIPTHGLWRNSLLIPRILGFLASSQQSHVPWSEIVTYLVINGGYALSDVLRTFQRLVRYRLAEPTLPADPVSYEHQTPASFHLTECGTYYARSLMFRLEYLQAMYWDIALPAGSIFSKFAVVMPISLLEPFRDSFCEFIADEEIREENQTPEFAAIAASHHHGHRLSDVVRSTTDGQLWRIYESEARRERTPRVMNDGDTHQ